MGEKLRNETQKSDELVQKVKNEEQKTTDLKNKIIAQDGFITTIQNNCEYILFFLEKFRIKTTSRITIKTIETIENPQLTYGPYTYRSPWLTAQVQGWY